MLPLVEGSLAGRQYVVIAAGGSYQAQTTQDDNVISYALPK